MLAIIPIDAGSGVRIRGRAGSQAVMAADAHGSGSSTAAVAGVVMLISMWCWQESMQHCHSTVSKQVLLCLHTGLGNGGRPALGLAVVLVPSPGPWPCATPGSCSMRRTAAKHLAAC